MQTIDDILQGHARQRGRTGSSPLVFVRSLDGRAGERVSHLPVSGDLGQAWVALTGEPFRPHQAHALTALRRHEPVALRAESSGVAATQRLLTYATLTPEPSSAALAITYDALSARLLYEQFLSDQEHLPQNLRLSLALAGEKQPNPYARVVISSAEQLHGRLLRHHDRAWRLLWARMRMLVLPELDRFHGIAAAHMADLLMRSRRIAAAHGAPAEAAIVATIGAIAVPEPALAAMLGMPWRIVTADDDAQRETSLAIWQAGSARIRDAAELALAFQRSGYYVHICCNTLERGAILPIVGETELISVGPDLRSMQILILLGHADQPALWRRALHAGYHAVVMVLGDLPQEQLLGQRADTLLSMPPAEWPSAPANAYVTAQHLLCAANELPLTVQEVESWGAQEIVDRLVKSGHLVDLPDAEICWKPGPQAEDPYPEFHLLAPSGSGIRTANEQRQSLGMLDPTIFERWAYPQAALPPLAGAVRVLARDEEHASVVLRLESSGRRSLPLRRATVTVRDQRQARAMVGGAQIAWGRVLVDEEIYGSREHTPGSAAVEQRVDPVLKSRWVSLACWFELQSPLQVTGQLVGWSLTTALPQRALALFTDLTPCYDHEQRRLYFVDSHPGGSGSAAWLFSNAEQILPHAYDIAYACRNDPLLEPLSRVDMDWLLALLGRSAPARSERAPAEIPAARPSGAARTPDLPPAPAAAGQPFIELPPRRKPENQPPPSKPAAPRQEPPPARQERFGVDLPSEPARQQPKPVEPLRPTSPPVQKGVPPSPPPPSRQPTPAAEPEEGPPDPAALIARLRRQREQREGPNRPIPPASSPPRRTTPTAASSRFKVGMRIFCLPYGDGAVQSAEIIDGREVLRVVFADHGELEVDPVVNLVRIIEEPDQADDDLL
ncbi:MAG: helicase [Roseiflexaceae bacterium]